METENVGYRTKFTFIQQLLRLTLGFHKDLRVQEHLQDREVLLQSRQEVSRSYIYYLKFTNIFYFAITSRIRDKRGSPMCIKIRKIIKNEKKGFSLMVHYFKKKIRILLVLHNIWENTIHKFILISTLFYLYNNL